MARGHEQDRSRMVLTLAVILWVSAGAALFVGIRMHAKPIMVVGLLDAFLALAVTMIALRGGGSRSR